MSGAKTGKADVAEDVDGGPVPRDRAAAVRWRRHTRDHAGAEVLAAPGLVKRNRRRRCLGCQKLFRCDPRTRGQRYCSEPACRTASKKDSQQRWLQKPENQDYFCGPQHVARVQAWRAAHPDYPGRERRGAPAASLQEMRSTQALDAGKKSLGVGLQEMKRRQAPEATGIRGAWPIGPLQDAM
jgi:hypothetical protein